MLWAHQLSDMPNMQKAKDILAALGKGCSLLDVAPLFDCSRYCAIFVSAARTRLGPHVADARTQHFVSTVYVLRLKTRKCLPKVLQHRKACICIKHVDE